MWKRIFGKQKQAEQFIIVVSGLPRSGTSMMMSMLEAGGIEVVVDNIRKSDEDNPNGYYEFERVKKLKEDSSWLDSAYGKAVKIISMLLYDLPQDKKYKVIFMKRDMEETLNSQKTMLSRRGSDNPTVSDDEMGKIFEKHVDTIETWLKDQKNFAVLYMMYHEIIENPSRSAQAVQAFLGKHLDVQNMTAVVDRTLYRNRASQRLPGQS